MKALAISAALAMVVATASPAMAGETSIEKPNPLVYALPVVAVVVGLLWGVSASSSDSKTAAVKQPAPKEVKVVGGPWVSPNGGGVALGVSW